MKKDQPSKESRSFEREIRNFVLGGLLFLLFLAGLLLMAYRNLVAFSVSEIVKRFEAQTMSVAHRIASSPPGAQQPPLEEARTSALLRAGGARQAALYGSDGNRLAVASYLPDADLAPLRIGKLPPPGESLTVDLEVEPGGARLLVVVAGLANGGLRTVYDVSLIDRILQTERAFTIVVPVSAAAIVVLVIPFLRRLMRPIDALTQTARGAGSVLSEEPDLKQRADEAENAIATFARTIAELKRRTVELEELRRREQERADALAVTADTLVRSHPGGLLVAGADGLVSEANPSALNVLALSREALGQPVAEVFSHASAIKDAFENAARGQATAGLEFSLGDSTLGRRLALTAVPVIEASGKFLGTILFIEDRTATRRLERELNLKRELASLGEMSAGIAHEFRNATATILGYARLASQARDGESLARHLAAIRREGEHIARVTGDFLLFARPERMSLSRVDLGELIQDAVGEEGLTSTVIEIVLGPGTLFLRADSALLRRALVNLLRNAVEAVDGMENPKVVVSAQVMESSMEVSVEDNGAGVPEKLAGKLFVPFSSSKENGTGLGLALVAKIAALHGGTIRLEAAARLGGARFVLELPVSNS